MADLLCATVVGRRHELGVLDRALDAAAAGAGSTVLVTGEAGVGKTRLLREVRARCGARGGVAMTGRATDRAITTPFRLPSRRCWPRVELARYWTTRTWRRSAPP